MFSTANVDVPTSQGNHNATPPNGIVRLRESIVMDMACGNGQHVSSCVESREAAKTWPQSSLKVLGRKAGPINKGSTLLTLLWDWHREVLCD